MTINTSSLPTGQPISARWVKVGPSFTFTEEPAGRDLLEYTPAASGQYYGIAWANNPAIPDFRGALIWLDDKQRFGFRQGGYRATNAPAGQPQYVLEKGGVVSAFQLFTI